MNPSVIAVMMHLGQIIQLVKDVEKGVADIVSGRSIGADAKAVLEDVCNLFTSGLLNLPGLSAEQMNQVVAELRKVA